MLLPIKKQINKLRNSLDLRMSRAWHHAKRAARVSTCSACHVSPLNETHASPIEFCKFAQSSFRKFHEWNWARIPAEVFLTNSEQNFLKTSDLFTVTWHVTGRPAFPQLHATQRKTSTTHAFIPKQTVMWMNDAKSDAKICAGTFQANDASIGGMEPTAILPIAIRIQGLLPRFCSVPYLRLLSRPTTTAWLQVIRGFLKQNIRLRWWN